MSTTETLTSCLSCGRSDEETPLLTLRFAGGQTGICPRCLPVLIHHQERLIEKLASARKAAALGKKKG